MARRQLLATAKQSARAKGSGGGKAVGDDLVRWRRGRRKWFSGEDLEKGEKRVLGKGSLDRRWHGCCGGIGRAVRSTDEILVT